MKKAKARFALFALAALTAFFGSTAPVWAGPTIYGRQLYQGYFTGNGGGADWDFVAVGNTQYPGLLGTGTYAQQCAVETPATLCNVTLASFIQGFSDRLNDATSVVNQGRAAATIDIMLGKNGPDFGGSIANGIVYAQANWSAWVSLVQAYASGSTPGYSVDWNAYVNFDTSVNPNFQYNGLGARGPGLGFGGGNNNDGEACFAGDQCVGDINFNSFNDAAFDYAVVFMYPGGNFYIKHKCGNLTGDVTSLPSPPPPGVTTANCGGYTTNMTAPDPKEGFNLTVNVIFNPISAAAADFGPDTMTMTFNGVFASTTSPTITNGVASMTMAVPPTNSAGVFPVTWNVSGTQLPTASCSDNMTIAGLPYLSVQAGDIQTGGPMGLDSSGVTNCSTIGTDPKAGVVSWNQEGSGNYAGAGTSYAVEALNYLQDFATAQGSTTGNSQQPLGLSFSNTNFTTPTGGQNVNTAGTGSDTYGGNFGLISCMPDFTANLDPATMVTAPTSMALPALAPSASGHTIFYVKGSVLISNNVAIFGGSYVNLSGIPSYTIVTTGGNIYIDGSVTHLDGLYIAEPDSSGNGGNIYTCTTVPTATIQNSDPNLTLDTAGYYDACNNPLTVNGAFVAKQVLLLRTKGTLHDNTPAETFNFTPEVWLSTPFDSTTSGGAGAADDYDAITSLPPTL